MEKNERKAVLKIAVNSLDKYLALAAESMDDNLTAIATERIADMILDIKKCVLIMQGRG